MIFEFLYLVRDLNFEDDSTGLTILVLAPECLLQTECLLGLVPPGRHDLDPFRRTIHACKEQQA